LRIKEQETRLTLQEHDDDDDDEKRNIAVFLYSCRYILMHDACLVSDYQLYAAGMLVGSAALYHCNSFLFRCDI